MRDKNRIEPTLKIVKELWKKYPDLRLGQLLINAASVDGTDLFYIEDYDLLQALNKIWQLSPGVAGASSPTPHILLSNSTDKFKKLAYKRFLESGNKASFETLLECFSNDESWFNPDGTIACC